MNVRSRFDIMQEGKKQNNYGEVAIINTDWQSGKEQEYEVE